MCVEALNFLDFFGSFLCAPRWIKTKMNKALKIKTEYYFNFCDQVRIKFLNIIL